MNRKFSTMKKPILILSLLFIHYACLFSPTVQNGLNPTKSNTIPAWILGLTGRGSEVSPEQNQIFDLEATTSGYSLPDVPIKGVSTITLAEDDTFTNSEEQVLSLSLMGNDSPNVGTRAANPNSPNFSTTKGVINYGFAILPSDIGVSDFTAQVWVNGQLSDINFDTTGAKTTNKLVLNNGKNYVLINVNSGDRPIARSNVYRIDSSVPDSMIRTEITWNGVGDLDLHADDGNGGKHVFWTYKKYTSANHNIELDVDNTKTHGPENIRIFTAPAGTSYRFYINYFRGFRDLKANAKIYKGTSLLESKTILFSVSDINASSVFNDKSKLIGVYTVGEIPVVIAPSNLLYTSSSYLFTNGSTITTQIPTFAGSLTNCVANPSLPTGLSINSTNCAISGTPTVNQAATSYTITASNSGGSTSSTISITINNAAPTNLVYPSSSYTFTNGTSLSTQLPTVTGTITNCVITPTLPTGLTIDATTCAISGTPTINQAVTSYTITASNSGGNTTANISITVNETPPANLVYTGSPYTFTNGTAIITQTPTVTGAITNCTANPSLPTGLSINATTCAISGTPTATQAATSYTITASNSGGNVTATISITINEIPPANLVYTGSPYTFTNGTAIITQTPTVTGAITNCTANPSLPTGLSIHATTCAISGTPTAPQIQSSYLITAVLSSGNATTSILINIEGWRARTSMPAYRSGLGAAELNGLIYVVGGTDSGNVKNSIWEYNPNLDVWSVKANMPTARSSLAVVSANNKIYAIGGKNDSNIDLNMVEEFDPIGNAWSTKTNMPTARSSLAASASNGKIYVVGGLNSGTPLTTVEEYNPTSDIWNSKASSPLKIIYHTVVTVNGMIYAIGGHSGFPLASNYTAVLLQYDVTGNSWTTKTSMPTGRSFLASAGLNGKIYATGGRNSSGQLANHESYDPITNSWKIEIAFPTVREAMTAVVANNQLYIIGGYPDLPALRTYEYTPP